MQSSNGFGLLSIDWGLGPSAEQVLAKARELVAAGTNAVQNELERLRKLQEEPKTLAAVRQAPARNISGLLHFYSAKYSRQTLVSVSSCRSGLATHGFISFAKRS